MPPSDCRASRSTPTTAAAFFSGPASKHRSMANAGEQRRRPGNAKPTPVGGGRSAAPTRGASVTPADDSVAMGEEQDGSVGQFLVESLTAQSLDLPPQVRCGCRLALAHNSPMNLVARCLSADARTHTRHHALRHVSCSRDVSSASV